MTSRIRSPLPWLGALLVLYLAAPIVAFLVRLTQGVAPAPGVQDALVTSLVTATISAAIIAILGIPLAYVLARSKGRLGTALTVFVALPLALPPLMSGILLLALVGPYTPLGRVFGGNLTDTPVGIVIAQTFVAAPFLVIAARGAFAGVDPELEDVARTLGHRGVSRFLHVALSGAWAGVQAGLILAWLRAFGEFGATVILAYHPYSLPVFTFVQFGSTGVPSTDLPMAVALAAALVVLAGVQLQGRRRRPRAIIPDATGPQAQRVIPLRFALQKRLGTFQLDLAYQAHTPRIALLGPSGSGKTLTLRLLAGITPADHADINAGGRAMQQLDPEERGIGYLPQRSALMPRRTVWDQVMFSIGADSALAAWWLQQLGIAGLTDRFADELSGGQQRRVALARALARHPSLVLLDEPFSALDAPLRHRLARDLRRLQRDTGLATVLVTHDPEEAALLADEIIVIASGVAIQQGSTADVFGHPASAAVAALIGVANTGTGVVHARGCVSCEGTVIEAPTDRLEPGTVVDWGLRAEDVSVHPNGAYLGKLVDAVDAGSVSEATVAIGSLQLSARGATRAWPRIGAPCRVDIPADAVMVWNVAATPAGGTAPQAGHSALAS
ncbi:MAG: ATP-binding cassette domain-containing protein [Candidatus Dormibacteraeota bacterium]|nr:ATP-binding cassette domain-containing protein [Candidatus Dormibacteraeota bacterium]